MDVIYRPALEWLTTQSRVRVHEHTVVDRLMEEWTDVTARRQKLAENFAKSGPFLTFVDKERQKYAGVAGWGTKETEQPRSD